MLEYCFNVSECQNMESKQYRIKCIFEDKINDAKWETKYKLRREISDSDIINALVYKFLDKLTDKDVLDYRREILKKED